MQIFKGKLILNRHIWGSDLKINFKGHWDRVFRWDEMIRSQQINFMPDNIYQEFLICSYKMGMEDAQWTSS